MKDIIRFISVASLIIVLGCSTAVPPMPAAHEAAPLAAISYHHYMQALCQWCGSTHDLNVHHIQPQHLHPELRDVPSNLVTLCRECHFVLGHKRNWTNAVPEIAVLFN